MATLEDLEVRVAALEAAQADYRAVLTAVNALGANQREHSQRLSSVESGLAAVESELAEVKTEMRGFRRSTEENLAEIKDLLVRALDR